jgi:hypothetical protein
MTLRGVLMVILDVATLVNLHPLPVLLRLR